MRNTNEIYDTAHSIVFRDKLDLLLNNTRPQVVQKSNTSQDDAPDCNFNKYSRLEQHEILYYNHRKCGECEHRRCNPKFMGGIVLPNTSEEDRYGEYGGEGSGNMVIIGEHGTGKSTLAFQIAAACADELNKGISVYYSLEITRTQIIENYIPANNDCANKLFYFSGDDEKDNLTSGNLSKRLQLILKRGDDKADIKPQILFPHLSPRGITASTDDNDNLYMMRYKEIQYMLRAIVAYNKCAEKENYPKVKAIIVDSLNVFGDKQLTREEIFRLFNLFKENRILGIFTLEKYSTHDVNAINFVNNVKYMADVVISLTKSEYNHYYHTYLEIEKSRNIPQATGKHPYKIRTTNDPKSNIIKKLFIYPSMHYMLFGSENRLKNKGENANRQKKNVFGIEGMEEVLPQYFSENNSKKDHSKIISITGKSGMFKSDLAVNALLYGITQKENGLIIRLNDRIIFNDIGVRINEEINEHLCENERKEFVLKTVEMEGNDFEHKYALNKWTLLEKETALMEIVFKGGALLPEEFVDTVCRIINEHNINNIAFIDIKSIGISYPFLINSETSASMFISAFIHLMRNYGVNVFFSSSYSDVKESDDEVKKTVALSDAVIVCEKTKNEEVILTSPMTALSQKRISIIFSERTQCCRIIENGEEKRTSDLSMFVVKVQDMPLKSQGVMRIFKIKKESEN